MNGKCASRMIRINYYSFYQKIYAPFFKEIDVALKTLEQPLNVAETAALLRIPEAAVRRVMAEESITRLDQCGILTVMGHAESALCRLYQRELLRGGKAAYSPADIAYIYNLSEEHVKRVCVKMGIREALSREVPLVLRQLTVFVIY